VAIGMAAGSNLTTGSNNIDIGFNVDGLAGESNTIRIGKSGTQTKTVIAGIRGTTIANGQPVVINSNGQLGTVTSSERFKDQIKSMDKVSESILNLKPVTFRYKEEFDPEGIPQFGLIAEQVEKVNPDLVVRDDQGKVNTVRYDAVNAMLLNEFLKEHQTVQDLKSTVAKQEAAMAQRQKQIEALTATVQKVSEQVALSKRSPQLVANP
jgi:Chaperone of endosialidase